MLKMENRSNNTVVTRYRGYWSGLQAINRKPSSVPVSQRAWKLMMLQRPQLDTVRKDAIISLVDSAWRMHALLDLTLYGAFQYTDLQGVIEEWDTQMDIIRLRTDEGSEWVSMGDIVGARYADTAMRVGM